MAGYLDALAVSVNPQSTLRWIQTPAFGLIEELIDGELEISHDALDQRQGTQSEGSAVAYLRAALVAHHALAERDETAAAFQRWLSAALDLVPDGTDRSTIAAFATWHVARQLAATTARHRGAPPPSAIKHARSQVRQAIALTHWLHGQQLQLGDLRQDLLDQWLTAGSSTRRTVNPFIAWINRSHLTGSLEISWPVPAQNPPIASDAQRLHALNDLLTATHVDPATRFAAAAVLLFAQPLTRIVAMRRDDLTHTDDGWQLRFGRRPVQAPAVLDDLLVQVVSSPGPPRTAASQTDWLFPGRKHGSHVTAEDLRRDLTVLDLPIRPGRHGALLALAAALPAPVLSEHFGVHRSRAAQWNRAAGRDYGDYVAARTVTGNR